MLGQAQFFVAPMQRWLGRGSPLPQPHGPDLFSLRARQAKKAGMVCRASTARRSVAGRWPVGVGQGGIQLPWPEPPFPSHPQGEAGRSGAPGEKGPDGLPVSEQDGGTGPASASGTSWLHVPVPCGSSPEAWEAAGPLLTQQGWNSLAPCVSPCPVRLVTEISPAGSPWQSRLQRREGRTGTWLLPWGETRVWWHLVLGRLGSSWAPKALFCRAELGS